MAHHPFSSPIIDTIVAVIIAAAALSHSYTPDICALLGCDGPALLLVGAGTLAGMAAAAGLLMYRMFKYRSVDHSSFRSRATLTIVFIACTHTVTHNLCHASVGECNALPTVSTVVLLVLVSGILGINPNAVWPVGTGDTEGPKTADRSYLNTMIDDRYFVWAYWTATVSIIVVVWVLGIVEWLFEPEILVPLLAGLFGPFIALWFANRERNKRIMENYFYKTQSLLHIGILLDNAILRFRRRQDAGLSSGGGTDMPKDGGTAIGDEMVLEYQYHKGHVENLSTNTYVHADIRYHVLNFTHALDDVLTQYLPLPTPNGPTRTTEIMLRMLDIMNELEYFTTDRDPSVRSMWHTVKPKLYDVRAEVAKLT